MTIPESRRIHSVFGVASVSGVQKTPGAVYLVTLTATRLVLGAVNGQGGTHHQARLGRRDFSSDRVSRFFTPRVFARSAAALICSTSEFIRCASGVAHAVCGAGSRQ